MKITQHELINKVRESRFIMVRDRQVNKFNRLTNRFNNTDREKIIIVHELQVVAISCKIYTVPIMAIVSLKVAVALTNG